VEDTAWSSRLELWSQQSQELIFYCLITVRRNTGEITNKASGNFPGDKLYTPELYLKLSGALEPEVGQNLELPRQILW